jgi:hypothetical protein
VPRQTAEDRELQRRVDEALRRSPETKARRAERKDRRAIRGGGVASYLEAPSSTSGGGNTDRGPGAPTLEGTSPSTFLPPIVDVTTHILWAPQPGPQYHFIHCPITDVVYGGARGGGKTYALIGDAAIRAAKYGEAFRGLFIRRQQVELLDVKAKMREIYSPVGAKWNEQSQTWTFPGGGVLILKYLSNDDDALMYKGWNVTALYVDEIGDFPSRKTIDLLWGAMRSAKGIPVVRRMSCNPGGPGHMWVKQLYLSKGAYRVFRYAPNPDRPDLEMDAVFIPATLEDNKILMQNDPQYEVKLAAACGGDTVLYDAWRHGNWDALAGTYFQFDEKIHVVVPPPMPSYLTRWIGMDWGYSHGTGVTWFADYGERCWIYRERLYTQTDPVTLGQFIAEVNGDEEIGGIYLSPDAFAKRTSEQTVAMGLHEGFRRAHEMRGCALMPEPTPADNDRVNGWQALASGFQHGKLLISPDCPELIRTLQGLVRDPRRPNDVQKVDGDDLPDAARYGWMTKRRSVREPLEIRAAREVCAVDPNERAMQERLFWARERGSAGILGKGVLLRGGRREIFRGGFE